MLHNGLAYGLDSWLWSYELGQSLIKAMSFSGVGSPFFWLSMPFAAENFPYLAGWIYCIKYVAAAAAAYFYVLRFVRDDRYAVLAALLYAFSGYQSVNLIFYSFHDMVALFPLLLIGLERTMQNHRDRAFFIFAVFINCLTNYFFFVQEVVFLLIYFVFRFWCRDFALLSKRILNCLLCGFWGVCMAAVLFLPNALYMLNSPRMSAGDTALFYDLDELLFVIKGMLFPAEAMPDNSAIRAEDYLSVSCYMPMLGLMPLMLYVKKNRDWLSGIMVFCLIVSLCPLLDSGFMLFTEVYYRWWFMFCLMMALAAAIVLENIEDYKLSGTALVYTGLNVLLLAVIVLLHVLSPEPVVYHAKRLIAFLLISVSGVWLGVYIIKRRKKMLQWLCLGVACYGVFTSVSVMSTYKLYVVPRGEDVKQHVALGTQLEVIDPQYRYNIENNNNVSMTGGASSMSAFSSLRNEGSIMFDELFDYYLGFSSMRKDTIDGLPQLLGGKYYLSAETDGSHLREYEVFSESCYVLETEACPIGFAMDRYIPRSEFELVTLGRKGIALLQAGVVEPEDGIKLSGYADAVAANELDLAAGANELSRENSLAAVENFTRDAHGFKCTAAYEKDCLIYFSVPYDKGWTAFVDGQERDIICSGGMMLLPIEAGEHSIEFEYSCPGYRAGLVLSGLGFAAFFGLLWLEIKKKERS